MRSNQLVYRDSRYKKKIGFKIQLKIATISVPVLSLFKESLWKKSSMVTITAKIKVVKSLN